MQHGMHCPDLLRVHVARVMGVKLRNVEQRKWGDPQICGWFCGKVAKSAVAKA